jgi:hypothetical protein
MFLISHAAVDKRFKREKVLLVTSDTHLIASSFVMLLVSFNLSAAVRKYIVNDAGICLESFILL